MQVECGFAVRNEQHFLLHCELNTHTPFAWNKNSTWNEFEVLNMHRITYS